MGTRTWTGGDDLAAAADANPHARDVVWALERAGITALMRNHWNPRKRERPVWLNLILIAYPSGVVQARPALHVLEEAGLLTFTERGDGKAEIVWAPKPEATVQP